MASILHSLSPRRLVGVFIIAFVLAGVLVGYGSQPQTLPAASTGGYGVINGPALNGTIVPGVMQQVTYFSTTTPSWTLPTGGYSTSFGGRMIEQDGYLTIQVADVKSASDQAAQLAASLQGYVASSSFDDSGSDANIVLRIPESNFSLAMRALSGLGIVKAQSISSDDVTEQYVNLRAQLDSYTTEDAVLIRILNSSRTVQDALDSENAIQNTQAQIDDLEGQLRVMQRLIAFATINVDFTQPARTSTLDFGDALNSALAAFYTVTRGMLILGASLIPVAIIGGIVYVPYKHFSRKKPLEAK